MVPQIVLTNAQWAYLSYLGFGPQYGHTILPGLAGTRSVAVFDDHQMIDYVWFPDELQDSLFDLLFGRR